MEPLYVFTGTVLKGNQLGRTIGFPTVNFKPPSGIPFPLPYGIYAVKIRYGDRLYNGMANAGIKPTLEAQDFSIEVNIFDFSQQVYGEEMTVYFYDYIREERKFPAFEELRKQIELDKQQITRILSDRM